MPEETCAGEYLKLYGLMGLITAIESPRLLGNWILERFGMDDPLAYRRDKETGRVEDIIMPSRLLRCLQSELVETHKRIRAHYKRKNEQEYASIHTVQIDFGERYLEDIDRAIKAHRWYKPLDWLVGY